MIACPKCGDAHETAEALRIKDPSLPKCDCEVCSGTGRVTLWRWILAKIGVTHVL